MNVNAHIGALFERDTDANLLERLATAYPEGRIRHFFELDLPQDDPRTKAALTILSTAGLRPWTDHSREIERTHEFRLTLRREYTHKDFERCDLLELGPSRDAVVEYAWRDNEGLIQLPGNELKKRFDFASCLFGWFVVPERVKHLLKESGLKNIVFKTTIPMIKSQGERLQLPNWSYWGKPWWELDSDFTMPPLAPNLMFTDRDGKPVRQGDFSNGFHVKEGLYAPPELHYRKSDLANLRPFDLARTYEPFGNRQGYDRGDCKLIVSQRFYQFCQEHGLKADWVPVRIDPE